VAAQIEAHDPKPAGEGLGLRIPDVQVGASECISRIAGAPGGPSIATCIAWPWISTKVVMALA